MIQHDLYCHFIQYMDVVPDEVIWTVNWLHYLNYEPIAPTSSTRHLFCTRNDLGQTVSSYGWCNGIPRVVPLFRSFSERIVYDRLSYQRKESLPRVDLVFSAFMEQLHIWPSFLRTGFHVLSPSYVLGYCFGICVSIRTYDISIIWSLSGGSWNRGKEATLSCIID